MMEAFPNFEIVRGRDCYKTIRLNGEELPCVKDIRFILQPGSLPEVVLTFVTTESQILFVEEPMSIPEQLSLSNDNKRVYEEKNS